MIPVNVTFLHYFDIHYLQEKGVLGLKKQIFNEANIATRFSILSSEVTIVPAALYIESELCSRILNNFISLIKYGIIELIGNAYSFKEFCERKIIQYANRPDHQQLYINALSRGVEFPFRKRQRSSTKDISNRWLELLEEEDVEKRFSCFSGIELLDKFQYKWQNLPTILGEKAFIVPNIVKELFKNNHDNTSLTNNLHGIINPSYFCSYIDELNASIVTDLNILEANYNISNNNLNIPYKYIFRELHKRNELTSFSKLRPDDLMMLRESEKWKDIFLSACHHKTKVKSEHDIFYKKIILPPPPTTINVLGDLVMGDKNKANQVGIQGRNGYAQNINFNQIWQQNKGQLNLADLNSELIKLRESLHSSATTAEHYSEIGAIATAEIEAKKGDGEKALEALSKASTWSLGVAEKIGIGVAIAALKTALGL